MRIDTLLIENFKGFKRRELSFHPQFNLIVGDNGLGKTSVLEALSVAAGSWFLGLRGYDTRHIHTEEVRLQEFITDESVSWERQYPCVIEARGEILDHDLTWKRVLGSAKGRTSYGEAREIKVLASDTDSKVRAGKPVVLPIISYYSTGRLWNVPRDKARVKSSERIKDKAGLSRLEAYRNSVDPRLSVSDLIEWIARQTWRTFQKGGKQSSAFSIVRSALVRNVQGATDVYFDAEYGEVIVVFKNGAKQPFNNLSDGQRCMLAVVGDLARKAATLNPQLEDRVLTETSGIVIIDELDLHLHPKWQRRVIEDLRTTFPRLQFICTTHSPFLIQSLRSGEELIMLAGQPTAKLGDLPLDDIARGIQGISVPQVSARYQDMKQVAQTYLETLEAAQDKPADKLKKYRARLAESIAPYADNPAFQAFLEMKRATKLGE